MNNTNFATSTLEKALVKFINSENTLGLSDHNSGLGELSLDHPIVITEATQLNDSVTVEFTQFFQDYELEEVESEDYVCTLTTDQIRVCL